MFQILHFEKPIPFMRYARPGVVFSTLLMVISCSSCSIGV